MQVGWEEAEEAEGEEILQGAERGLIKVLLQRSHLSAARFRYEEGREKKKYNVMLSERRVFFLLSVREIQLSVKTILIKAAEWLQLKTAAVADGIHQSDS